ncbi:hypothetical protein D3C81_2182140 [compost metagenome]
MAETVGRTKDGLLDVLVEVWNVLLEQRVERRFQVHRAGNGMTRLNRLLLFMADA